jgi:hypothetical protein
MQTSVETREPFPTKVITFQRLSTFSNPTPQKKASAILQSPFPTQYTYLSEYLSKPTLPNQVNVQTQITPLPIFVSITNTVHINPRRPQ